MVPFKGSYVKYHFGRRLGVTNREGKRRATIDSVDYEAKTAKVYFNGNHREKHVYPLADCETMANTLFPKRLLEFKWEYDTFYHTTSAIGDDYGLGYEPDWFNNCKIENSQQCHDFFQTVIASKALRKHLFDRPETSAMADACQRIDGDMNWHVDIQGL